MHSVRSLSFAPVLVVLLLSGCGAATAEQPATVPTAGSFRDAWPGLLAQLQAGHAEQLVEPTLGVVMLDNPGAFVTVTLHDNYAAAVATLPRSPEIGRCDLTAGELPQYSCDAGAYSTVGCIVTEPNTPRLLASYDAFVQYALEGVTGDPALRQRLARTQALATVTVTDTSRHTRWHFGVVDGRWRLLVVDIVVPCSA